MSKKDVKVEVLPLGDRVLVKRVEVEHKKSPAGIIIPDTAQKEKSKRGVVVSVGPGKYGEEGDLIPMSKDIKTGVEVFFNAGWDNEADIGEEGVEYFLVKESDILAIIK